MEELAVDYIWQKQLQNRSYWFGQAGRRRTNQLEDMLESCGLCFLVDWPLRNRTEGVSWWRRSWETEWSQWSSEWTGNAKVSDRGSKMGKVHVCVLFYGFGTTSADNSLICQLGCNTDLSFLLSFFLFSVFDCSQQQKGSSSPASRYIQAPHLSNSAEQHRVGPRHVPWPAGQRKWGQQPVRPQQFLRQPL